MKRREFVTSVARVGMMTLAAARDVPAWQASSAAPKLVPPGDRLIQVAAGLRRQALDRMTAGFLAAGSFTLAFAAASAGIQAVDAIEAYRRVLQANPNDAGAKMALKGLIDRPDGAPRERYERIREILRTYPWESKASLTLKDENRDSRSSCPAWCATDRASRFLARS